jgi:divalent metal cation (Fe/Co/Zn/Cd) transporter
MPELLPSLAQIGLDDRGPISKSRYDLYPESMESRAQTGNGAHCCDPCVAPAAMPRTVAWLQSITLVWMLAECAGALIAAFRAHSVALLAFGADSVIELLSAVVVLLAFLPWVSRRKEIAERAAAVLLFFLAGVVVIIALTLWHGPVETSCLGIAVTALALVIMPILAWLKRRQARALNHPALAADATQSATCAWLAAVTLAGLAAFALWHIRWIDSAAALVAVPVLMVEGRRAWRGEGCGC